MHEARVLEGRCVSSKSPSRVRDRDERVAGRDYRKWCFPDEGSLICPPGKSMIFYKKETRKMIELVARPGRRLAVAPNGQGGLEVVAEVVLRPQHPFEGNPD